MNHRRMRSAVGDKSGTIVSRSPSSLSERTVILRSKDGAAAGATKNLIVGALDIPKTRFFDPSGVSE